MGSFYKQDRLREVFRVPDAPESTFELVDALRKAGENDGEISRVLEKFSYLTPSQVRDSLLEVASAPDYAFVSLKAALQLGQKDVVQHAAGVIQTAAFLSDEVKGIARELLGSSPVKRVTMMGHGRGKRSEGDRSSKRRGS